VPIINNKYIMHRIILTYSSLAALLAFVALGCAETSNAQSDKEGLTASNSAPIQEAPAEELEENLDYMVTNWSSPVTRDEVKQYTSMMDFWGEETLTKYRHDNFSEIWVANLKDYPDWNLDVSEIDPELKATSPTEEFTEEQLAIVANADYSDHLRFSARFNSTRISTGEVEEYVLVSQSMSLVPDVQAECPGGFAAVESYLKGASRDHVKHVKRDEVGRCRIFFTVTNDGSIDDVKLIETSNYQDVDKAMIKVVKDMPLKWTPAQDENGDKVNQEFVFTFGRAGC
jgi:TonB family protein